MSELVTQPLLALPAPELSIYARPHPVAPDVYRVIEVRQGSTIRDIVGPRAEHTTKVEIAGIEVPPALWGKVRPKAGAAVVITRWVHGGGGFKGILRIVAFIVIAVIAVYTQQYYLLNGYSAAFAAGAAAVVGVVGALAVNALIPPQIPKPAGGAQDSMQRLNAITGTSNQANPYGPIPCVFGTVRYFPTLAALPYQETHGDEQYMRFLFDLGYGDPQISDMKIGDTDLGSFTDVEYEIGTAPTLFSDDVFEAAASDSLNTDGTTAIRTSAADADEVSIDLLFQSGLFGVDTKGNTVAVNCTISILYRPSGGSTWTNVASAPGLTLSNSAMTAPGDFLVKGGARKPLRLGVRWKVPAPGAYDVQVSRISTAWGSSDANARSGDLVWTIIRTIRHTNPSTTGTKKLALRIKATDQLNGTINQFNCIAAQPIPTWDGSGWTAPQVTDNPAWQSYWLLATCPANSRPVPSARMDLEEFKAWADDCTAKGLGYNCTVDGNTTVFEQWRELCIAGRASPSMRDGLYTVVRDQDLSGSTPVQVFTPRNSAEFQGSRTFADTIHGLRVQFINPAATWQQDERIVLDDGYQLDGLDAHGASAPGLPLATKFETLQIKGCTDATMAWKLARYNLAAARLRPNTYSWKADVEHIVCRRGSLVRYAGDVVSVGTGWGRVKALTVDGTGKATSITVDNPVDFDGKSHAVRLRCNDGTAPVSVVTPYGMRNLLQYTQDLANPGAWTAQALAPTTAAAKAASTGERVLLPLVPTTANGEHYLERIPTGLTANADYCAQIEVAAGNAKQALLRIYGTGNANHGVSVDFSTGEVDLFFSAEYTSGGGRTTSYGATEVAPGVWRLWVAGSPDTAATSRRFRLLLENATGSTTFAGDGSTPALYAGRAQFELGSAPTDYQRVDAAGTAFNVSTFNLSTPAAGVEVGNLFVFGVAGQETMELLVNRIEPASDLSARISAVDAAWSVLSADSGTVPTFTSQITGAPWCDPPDPPDLVFITSGVTQGSPNDGGVTDPVMTIGVPPPKSGRVRDPMAGRCVTVDTFLPCGKFAADVQVDDFLDVVEAATLQHRRGRVTYAATARAECVRIRTESGVELDCSTSAPIALAGGGWALAPTLEGWRIPVWTAGAWHEERVVSVEPLGELEVRVITCEDAFFLAGRAPGQYLLHHNMKFVPREDL